MTVTTVTTFAYRPFARTRTRVTGLYLSLVTIVTRCHRIILTGVYAFLPLQWSWSKDAARPMGIDFQKQALLEISVVTVSANAGALLVGASAPSTPTPEERARARRRRIATALRLHDGP